MTNYPNSSEIKGRLESGESPLDFIRKNLRDQNALPVPNPNVVPENGPARVDAIPPPVQHVEPSFKERKDVTPFPVEVEEEVQQGVEAAVGGDAVEQQTTDNNDDGEEKGDEEEPETEHNKQAHTKEDSIKNLRKIANAAKQEAEEVRQQLDSLRGELEAYEKGEKQPDRVAQLESRIAELEQYEALHNFKTTKEYKRKFTDPLNNLVGRARGIAEKYGVDANRLDDAMAIDNLGERNRFLLQFFDPVGAHEAASVIDQIKDLNTQAQEAEKEPVLKLQELQNQLALEEEESRGAAIESLISNTKAGWVAALKEVREKGEYPELTLRAQDEEHNKITRPIIEEASREFGKFLNFLGMQGIKELPPDVSKMLAKRFQLSQAAGVIAASRSQYAQQAEQIVTEAKTSRPLYRPQVGANGVKSAQAAPHKPRTSKEAAKELLSSMGLK